MRFFLFVTAAASIVATLVLVLGAGAAKSAPQEAAVAAYAIGIAVIPYVFARCCQLWESRDRAVTQHAELLAAVRDLQATQSRAPGAAAPQAIAHAQPAASPLTAPSGSLALKPAAMGTCSKCGARNILEAIRCSSCGTNFDEAGGARLQPST